MRMMPAGLFLGSLTTKSLTPNPSPKERGVIRLEGLGMRESEKGKGGGKGGKKRGKERFFTKK